VIGKQAVFLGADAQHHSELWVTDGTVAGTHELIIPGVWAGGLIGGQYFNPGLDPNYMTAFDGNRALFNGIDAGGHLERWVTDGAAAGTHELDNIPGESTSGLHPANFAAFQGNKALFDGLDSSGHFELWITDGTVSGTHELIIPGASAGGLNPTNITV